MGIIAITGAAVLMIPELGDTTPDQWTAMAIGAGAALVSGLGALWLFVWLLARQVFFMFSYYLWAAGGQLYENLGQGPRLVRAMCFDQPFGT